LRELIYDRHFGDYAVNYVGHIRKHNTARGGCQCAR
jgi:hypothetical protein